MTTATYPSENKILPVNSNGNIAITGTSMDFAKMADVSVEIYQLSSLLQTSLNVDEILAQFCNEMRTQLAHDGFSFVNEAHNINFVLGEHKRHACTYELTINNNNLGILSISRSERFSEDEIGNLERYLCTLHYPLRNAFLYSDAVNAAHKDPLTGIGNRAAMSRSVHREIELALRHKRNLGVMVIDIDHFKQVNDRYGHLAGDKVLQTLVHCLTDTVRISDGVFRYGGEEFVIILPETDEPGVLRLAKRIRRRIEKLPTSYQDQVIHTTISVGLTILQEKDDEKTLFQRADQALYQCKREGRNCIRIGNCQ